MVGVKCTHRQLAASYSSHAAPLLLLFGLLGSLPACTAEPAPMLEGSTVCTVSQVGCAVSPEEASVGSSLLQASKVVRDTQLPERGSPVAPVLAEHRFDSAFGADLQPYMVDFCTPEAVHLREWTSLNNAPACNGQLLNERSFLSETEWMKTAEAINSVTLKGNRQPSFNNGFAANVSWIHMSSSGATCLLKEAPAAATMRTSSQLVIDESELPTTFAPGAPACALTYGDSDSTQAMEAHFMKLQAAKKADIEAYRFSYKFRNRTYDDGRLRMVWYKPPVDCAPDGCPVVIYLHGLNHVSQLGRPASPKFLSGVEKMALRPSCEDDYQSLRSIILGPQFEPQAFPQAGPKLVTTRTETEFSNFQLRAQTGFHYHTQELDVFGDAIMPVLKEWTSQHHSDVDMNRIHLLGFSMGAVGAMVGAFNNMDFFASLVAISPCINADTDFPEPVVEWMPHMTAELAAAKKLNRIMMFIGEDDHMYEMSGASCVDAWSQLLGLAQDRGLINAQQEDHVEIRVLKDGAVELEAEPSVTGGTRQHCSAYQYGILELNAPLWEDRYC